MMLAAMGRASEGLSQVSVQEAQRPAGSGECAHSGGVAGPAQCPREGSRSSSSSAGSGTPFARCPLPPNEHALPIRVEAGGLNPHR